MINKIISGGQTGVDRAALDVAIKLNLAHGGWCPLGRLAELGKTIPKKYLLKETASSDYNERTALNIKDSDGTLILIITGRNNIKDGTLFTIQKADRTCKPYLIVNLSKSYSISNIANWVTENSINILNIAGPRESTCPGIYNISLNFIKTLMMHTHIARFKG